MDDESAVRRRLNLRNGLIGVAAAWVGLCSGWTSISAKDLNGAAGLRQLRELQSQMQGGTEISGDLVEPPREGWGAGYIPSLPVQPVTPESGVPFVHHGSGDENRVELNSAQAKSILRTNEFFEPQTAIPVATAVDRNRRLGPVAVRSEQASNRGQASIRQHVPTRERVPTRAVAVGNRLSQKPLRLPPTAKRESTRPTLVRRLASPPARETTSKSRVRVGRQNPVSSEVVRQVPANSVLEMAATQATTPSLTSSLAEKQLRTLTSKSIAGVREALRRKSTHTAKKHAVDAIRSIVASRDAAFGTAVHGKHLQTAFDAIREAEDFCGLYGAVDQTAVRRMVESHTTDALKEVDLEHLSAVKAVEAYLSVAKEHLVAASGSLPESAEALTLLGRVHKRMHEDNALYRNAVAMTLQQAAVEVSPENPRAKRE
ncbi:MAG: hypothetical protein AAF989_13445, partial [Planctomycetota bacterium]